MSTEILNVLQSSDNPNELVAAALTLARSKNAEDHRMLEGLLTSSDFLDRLDSPADYANVALKLRVNRVLDALRDNQDPGARQVLLRLTDSATFNARAERTRILISCLYVIRPSPPKAVDFWDAHSRPDDGFTSSTISAIVENGSEPALALLERKLSGPEHVEERKISWMRTMLLPHRNDLALLKSSDRLIRGNLSPELKTALLEVIFDYRPEEWYAPAAVRYPPDRTKASNAAKDALVAIAEYTLNNLKPDERLKTEIYFTLKEIGR